MLDYQTEDLFNLQRFAEGNTAPFGFLSRSDKTKLDTLQNTYLAIKDTAAAAHKLQTQRDIQVKLDKTTPTAFDGTQNIAAGVTGTLAVANGGTGVTNLDNATVGGAARDANGKNISATYAPLASPALTGTPTATTANEGDSSTRIATTAFVSRAIATLIGTAPAILDTLGEIAAAINKDANVYTTLNDAIATKQPKHNALTSISGLTTSANKMIYTTAANTYATTSLTAYARTLLDDTDAATARNTLDVPSKTGSGASGTWAISISGNAATATTAGTTTGNAATATKASQDADGNTISSTYLKLSGGTITGALNFNNNTWNTVGDDAQFGDFNVAGTLGIRGANGTTGLALVKQSSTTDYALLSYAGANLISGKSITAPSFLGTVLCYGSCSTAAGTAAKAVTVSGGFSLTTGAIVCINFTAANTAGNPTLNINSTGAKAIYAGSQRLTTSGLKAGTYYLYYDGTQYKTLITPAVTITSVSNLGWTANLGTHMVDLNTLAYWNGAYTGTTSNLAYCNQGAFGTIVTKAVGDYVTTTGTAAKATADASGNTITSTYLKGLSASGLTLTYTKGDNTTDTVTFTASTTDDKVAQVPSIVDSYYPIILKASTATSTVTTTTVFASGVTVNPSKNAIKATTFSGNATSATQLKNARNVLVNLGSTSAASFNGTASISPGITGTLSIAHGGTGATTAAQALTNIGAAAADHGNHVPSVQTAANDTFLRNDNSWQKVTPANIGAAASSHTHAASDIASGTLSTARGGTGNANGTIAKLTTARSLKVSLASTSAKTFDGSANVTTIGVGGILPVANGGTGANTAALARATLGAAAADHTHSGYVTTAQLGSTLATESFGYPGGGYSFDGIGTDDNKNTISHHLKYLYGMTSGNAYDISELQNNDSSIDLSGDVTISSKAGVNAVFGKGSSSTMNIGTGSSSSVKIGTGSNSTVNIGTGINSTMNIGTGRNSSIHIGSARGSTIHIGGADNAGGWSDSENRSNIYIGTGNNASLHVGHNGPITVQGSNVEIWGTDSLAIKSPDMILGGYSKSSIKIGYNTQSNITLGGGNSTASLGANTYYDGKLLSELGGNVDLTPYAKLSGATFTGAISNTDNATLGNMNYGTVYLAPGKSGGVRIGSSTNTSANGSSFYDYSASFYAGDISGSKVYLGCKPNDTVQIGRAASCTIQAGSASSMIELGQAQSTIGVGSYAGSIVSIGGGTGCVIYLNGSVYHNGVLLGSGGSAYYGVCSTAAGTAAKTVSVDSSFALTTGVLVTVTFSNAITAAASTLNVNSKGAKTIRYRGYNIPANAIEANSTYTLVYDGTYWIITGSIISVV